MVSAVMVTVVSSPKLDHTLIAPSSMKDELAEVAMA